MRLYTPMGGKKRTLSNKKGKEPFLFFRKKAKMSTHRNVRCVSTRKKYEIKDEWEND